MRFVLFVEVLLSLLFLGGLVGYLWRSRYWPTRLVWLGALAVVLYNLLGQVKAYVLDIPFDIYSWVGVLAYGLLLVGLVSVRRSVRRREQQRHEEG